MIKIEFLQDYQCCHKRGDVFNASDHFGETMIGLGVAKRIDSPERHKMVESPQKAKGHNVTGYTG